MENVRILVVDDDPFVRDIVELVLQAGDYGVETAENGAEAYEKCLSNSIFDLIILDMHMPGLSGLELTRQLRQNHIDIPIIILTGDRDKTAVGEVMASGADGLVVKDENIQETIIATVAQTLEKRRQ